MTERTNRAWVGDALELLAKGLKPFVKTHMSKTVPQGENWLQEFARAGRRTPSLDDPSFLLEVLDRRWRRIPREGSDARQRRGPCSRPRHGFATGPLLRRRVAGTARRPRARPLNSTFVPAGSMGLDPSAPTC